MSDQEHISPLRPGKGKLAEDRLMAYLEGKLSPAEQHEVERWLSEEGMESDAIEGLQAMRPADTRHSVDRLNHRLRRSLNRKGHKRKKLRTDVNVVAAILIILLLAVVAYIVIKLIH